MMRGDTSDSTIRAERARLAVNAGLSPDFTMFIFAAVLRRGGEICIWCGRDYRQHAIDLFAGQQDHRFTGLVLN